MFNVSCIHNTPKNATRVNSSIELAQVMKSLESFHDFSYIVTFLLFPWQNGDGYAFFSSAIFAANACFFIEKCCFVCFLTVFRAEN